MNRKKLLIICFVLILLIAGILTLKFLPRNQGLYKVTILPSLGGNFTLPQSINDKGQVAGYSEIARGVYHLFLWDKDNGIKDIGTVVNDNVFINNSGQIASSVFDSNGCTRTFIWDPNTGITTLPTLGGRTSYVFGINNKGQIVGTTATFSGIEHAFIWDSVNGIIDLTPTSTSRTIAWNINDRGQIIVPDKSLSMLLVEVKENKMVSSIPIPLNRSCSLNNNGYVVSIVQLGKKSQDIVAWHPEFGTKKLYHSNTELLANKFLESQNVNDNNQLIITVSKKDIEILGIKIISDKIENYMFDSKLGIIPLDGYVLVGRHEKLVLMDINNEGCIIGAIQSTKDSKSVGVLFEPIPEKMEQKSKKSNTHK